MKPTIFKPLLIAVLMLQLSQGIAQSKDTIPNVDFFNRNDTLWVTYDLPHARNNELFNVEIIVVTASGKTIYPISVSGDAGAGVTGGKGKMAAWDYNKDLAVIAEGIVVDVNATRYKAPPVAAGAEKSISRGTAMMFSAIVPGLGITKLNGGKPYWLMAVAFYGAAGASYLYYNSASKTLDQYLASANETERNDLYDQAKNKKTISTALICTAGAVWLGSMIWTAIHPNKTKPDTKGLSFGSGWDERFDCAQFSIRYNF